MFGETERWLAIWSLSGVAAMFVTAAPWFRFLGESFRYVEYSVPALCILTAARTLALNDPRLWQLAAAVAGASVVGILGSYYIAKLVTHHDVDRSALYEWIRKQPASILLTIDLYGSFRCAAHPHRAVQANNNAPTGARTEAYKRLITRWYPLPDTNLKALWTNTMSTCLLSRQDHRCNQVRDPEYAYDLSGYEEVFRQGRYRVLKPRKTGDQRMAA
jgi:hypothetical protein